MSGEGEQPDLLSRVQQVWPSGLSEAELKAIRDLSPRNREKLERRLVALMGLEPVAGKPTFETVADAADYANMGLSTFYAMLSRWKQSRDLTSLGVYASKSGDGASSRLQKRNEAQSFIFAQLQDDPDLGTLELVRRLAEAEHALSKTTALRLIGEVRRQMPVTGLFGRHLAVESAGMDLIDADGARMRLYAILDVETGILIGWSIEREGDRGAYGVAVDSALEFLAWVPSFRQVRSSGETALEARFLSGESDYNHKAHTHLTLVPSSTRFADRQTGALLVRALGNRVAGIWIGSGQRTDRRSYRTGRSDTMPLMTPAIGSEIWSAIVMHNHEQLKRMPDDGDAFLLEATISSIKAQLRDLMDALMISVRGSFD